MIDSSKVQQWLIDLASDDEARISAAAQALYIQQNGDLQSEEEPDESLQAELAAEIHKTLNEPSFPSSQVLQALLELSLQMEQQSLGILSQSEAENFVQDSLQETMYRHSACQLVLSQAGAAATPLQDKLIELLKTEIGDEDGLSSNAHKILAAHLLANSTVKSTVAFDAVLEMRIEEGGHFGQSSIIKFCQREPALLDRLFANLDTDEKHEELASLLEIFSMVAKHCPEARDRVLGILRTHLKDQEIEIAAEASAGIITLDAIDDDIEKQIRQRREIELANADYEETFDDDADFVSSDMSRDQLLGLLRAQDVYERARACEALGKFAHEPKVAEALLACLDDDEYPHDFDCPANYAIRSLYNSGVLAAPAVPTLCARLEACLQAFIQSDQKNAEYELMGITYGDDTDYSVDDLARLLASIGPLAHPAEAILLKLERYLILRDIWGEDSRV